MSDAPVADALLVGLVQDAVCAVSMHNAQPWCFRHHRATGTVDVLRDTARAMERSDPDNRGQYLACGAALLNLRVAAARAGLFAEVTLLPESREPTLAASVRLRPAGGGDRQPALGGLYEALRRRHTSRQPFVAEPVPHWLLAELSQQARAEDAWLDYPSAWHAALVAQLTAQCEAEADRLGDPDEAAWYERPPAAGGEPVDGVPWYAVGPRPVRGRVPSRDFSRGTGRPRVAAEFESDPAMALLSTNADTPESWLHAGQALERVLLHATHRGLATSLSSRALEKEEQRWLLRDPTHGRGPVQMVLRLGYGPVGSITPRRPVADVLEFVD
ncbi:Acg family FMN-binding oxidoreductase [Streptomyces sp. NPDC059740]|uniref:Acg family FMN-binding oxidoreductase n=1 Tax=Streptomyces sp. NPDC059740 TaxID=3346926 RepID=UPI00364AECF9